MSLKVWEAYRLKKSSSYWPLTQDIQKIGTLRLRTYLTEHFLKLMDCVDTNSEAYKKGLERESEGRVRADIVDKLLKEGYKAATISPYRSPFNFDVSVSFREYKGRVYLIPCSNVPQILDFLREDSRLEDYHYQNQTDRPPEISRTEWSRRGKVWGTLSDTARWPLFTTVEICSWNSWWEINPYFDLLRSGAFSKWEKKSCPVADIIRDAVKGV